MPKTLLAILILGLVTVNAQPRDSTFEMLEAERQVQTSWAIEAGYAFSGTPEISFEYEFRRGWQTGLGIRTWAANAERLQDDLPEITWHFRRLWLAAEERSPLQNSEYVEFGGGFFPAYSFGYTDFTRDAFFVSDAIGYQPMIRAAIGKYWMPFSNLPFGMDANLVLGRYLKGHPPLFAHQDLLTITISFFWTSQRLSDL